MSTETLARTLLQSREFQGAQLLYGTATGNNTVKIAGSTVAVTLPALSPVVSGQYVAVLAAGADRLIIGAMSTAWTTLPTYGNGWGNYGSGWQVGQYRRVGDEVQLRGLLYYTHTTGTTYTICTMPTGFRAADDCLFPAMAYATTSGVNFSVRVSVYPSGALTIDQINPHSGVSWPQSLTYVDISTIRYSVSS